MDIWLEEGIIYRAYTSDDGVLGVHAIPMEAVAVRMGMLGFNDPALALEAIFREGDVAAEGVDVYAGVYEALTDGSDLVAAQEEARAKLALMLGPDPHTLAQFKEFLCDSYTEALRLGGEQFLENNSPTPAPAPDPEVVDDSDSEIPDPGHSMDATPQL